MAGMRAMVCSRYGGPEELAIGELPTPRPGPGQVAIRVHHAGVSFVDSLMIANRHQNKHELPFAPGMEVAGEISELGEGIEGLAVGDRVAALVYDGGWAEIAVADAFEVFPLPAEVSTDVAAAVLSVYLTAYLALAHVAELREGESLVITGAAGGVGLGAVEIGRALHARVVACASSEEKLSVARERGAEIGLLYGENATQELRSAIRERFPDGIDVVLDPVAGPVFEPTFRSLGWGGRYVSVGFAGGAVPSIPANLLLVKNRSARGFILMYYRRFRRDLLQDAAARIVGWIQSGRLRPLVSEVAPLSEAARLVRDILDRRARGKSAVTLL